MPAPHVPVTGGCLCGAVRYESEEAPVLGSYCHCKMCQKGYGGLYQAIVKFSGSGFRFTNGSPTHYRSSSYGKRAFCAACGSPIAFLYEGNPSIYVLVGSLDHPEDWPLTKGASWGQSYHWFVDDRVAWERIDDGLPQAGEPPSGTAARAQFGAGSSADPE